MKIGETYFKEIDVDLLKEAPYNVAGRTTDEDIEWLAKSIANEGLYENLRVVEPEGDGKYEIVMGHRRWKAAKQAGIRKVRCEVISSDYTESQRRIMNLKENVHRKDLTYEQKYGYLFEIMKEYDDNTAIVAQVIQWPESRVVEQLKYGALPLEVREKVKSPDDFRNAVATADLSVEKALEVMKVAREQALNSRQVANIAESMKRDPKLRASKAAERVKTRGTTVSISLDGKWNKALSDAVMEMDTTRQRYAEEALQQRLQREGYAPAQEKAAAVTA